MYGSAGLLGVSWPTASPYAFSAAPLSAGQTLSLATLGVRPRARTPTYRRPGDSVAETVRAKNESRRSGPGGGNTAVEERANRAWIWSWAHRTVAVDATIFGRTPAVAHRPSIAVS